VTSERNGLRGRRLAELIKVAYPCSVRKRNLPPKGDAGVLTIKESAALLGVSEVALRRWHKAGKFVPHRHPLNGYRCYRRDDLLKLRKRIETGKAA
jgi:MerR HTH family regulatory protein